MQLGESCKKENNFLISASSSSGLYLTRLKIRQLKATN